MDNKNLIIITIIIIRKNDILSIKAHKPIFYYKKRINMDKCVLLREFYRDACEKAVSKPNQFTEIHKFDCKFYKRIFDLKCGSGTSQEPETIQICNMVS